LKYASIVPLIGGETIAMENVFGKRPEYMLSYDGFQNNDQHIVEHYNNEVPYHIMDPNVTELFEQVDVVNAVCPCAGLSSLSPSAGSDNAANDWMSISANYVLEHMKPKVFWGENAPRLASKMGEPVVAKLRSIAKKNGYTFSIFKTKSLLHGLSQVRDRSFYFFWKDEKVPMFDYTFKPHMKIEDTIRSVPNDPNDPMSQILTNTKRPTDNPFYKYVLEEMHGGITHQEFFELITKTTNPLDYIEDNGITYDKVAEWMRERGFEREAAKCDRMYAKLKAGGNIMRKNTEIPKDFIGAFVGHMPTSISHPDEDRYLTIREAMEIMKLPRDFSLQGGLKNLNHICQNVPVTTAEDMAKQIEKYLAGKLDYIDTDFMIQCNKTQTVKYENTPLNLEDLF
jgi:site-specific DNA-cytosine methylase